MRRVPAQAEGPYLKTVGRFREVPFPDMLAALRNNAVTAVGATEPFVTLGKEQVPASLAFTSRTLSRRMCCPALSRCCLM